MVVGKGVRGVQTTDEVLQAGGIDNRQHAGQQPGKGRGQAGRAPAVLDLVLLVLGEELLVFRGTQAQRVEPPTCIGPLGTSVRQCGLYQCRPTVAICSPQKLIDRSH